MDTSIIDGGNDRSERRERAYRHAADTHRHAEATELAAAEFFDGQGDFETAARHRRNAELERDRADADDARADAAGGGSA